jgi:hypothetical protein
MRHWSWLVLLLALPSLAAGQSLADVARKEAERRKKNKEAGIKAPVFTDADKPRTEEGAAAKPSESPSPPTVPPATTTESSGRNEADERAQKEQMWRSRKAAAVARRDEAKRSYERLNELWLAPGETYVDDQGRTVIRDLEQLRGMIARAKAEWDAAEKAIVDLEEDARRAGALPGWLR